MATRRNLKAVVDLEEAKTRALIYVLHPRLARHALLRMDYLQKGPGQPHVASVPGQRGLHPLILLSPAFGLALLNTLRHCFTLPISFAHSTNSPVCLYQNSSVLPHMVSTIVRQAPYHRQGLWRPRLVRLGGIHLPQGWAVEIRRCSSWRLRG